MTDKEAIKYLQQLYPNGGHCWLDEQRIEAIGMAIQALQREPVSEDLAKIDVPQEDTEKWLYNNIMINAPDVLNPLYQCFFIKEKATDKRWVYSRRRTDVNSEWGEWKKYLYDYE